MKTPTSFTALLAAFSLAIPPANAANKEWIGTTSTDWATGTNWNGGRPTNDLLTDIAYFNQSTYSNRTRIGSASSVYGLQVGDGTVAATMDVYNSSLALGLGGISIREHAGTASLLSTLQLSGSQTWNHDGNGLLTIGTLTALENHTPVALTLTGAGSGGTHFSGVISNNSPTGIVSFVVNTNGSGVTSFSGNNSFTGGITLRSGILEAHSHGNALGTGTLTLSGGELRLRHTGNLNFNRPVTITGNTTIVSNVNTAGDGKRFSFGALTIGAQTLTLKAGSNVTGGAAELAFSAITLGGDATLQALNEGANKTARFFLTNSVTTTNGHTLSLDGDGEFRIGEITGSGGLTLKNSFSGTAMLDKALAYTGTTTISGGRLRLMVDQTFGSLVMNGGTIDIGTTSTALSLTIASLSGSGTISNDQTAGGVTYGRLLLNGAGTQTFEGTVQDGIAKKVEVRHTGTGIQTFTGNNTFTGGLMISAGKVRLGHQNAGGRGTVTLNVSEGLEFEAGITQFTIGGIAGSHAIRLEDNTGEAITLTLAGGDNSTSVNGITGKGSLVIELTGGARQIMTGASFTGGVTLKSGTLTLNGVNTFTGGATVDGGLLTLSHSSGLGTGNRLTVNGGEVDLLGTSGTTITGLSGTGGRLTNTSATVHALLNLNINESASYGGEIADGASRSLGLRKIGSGTQTLTGTTSTYTGVTTIEEGTLEVSRLADIGLASSIGRGGAAESLVLKGGTLRYIGSGDDSNRLVEWWNTGNSTLDASGTGALRLTNTGAPLLTGSAARTLTLAGTNNDLNTLAWTLSDQAINRPTTLRKQGTGHWVLTGESTYTGPTQIEEGTLWVNGSILSNVELSTGATLGGTGKLGSISGSGRVAPGNSPGILTATSIDANAGLNFHFAMTQADAPDYSNAANSGNALLRLTGPSPFTIALSESNTIEVDFTALSLSTGMTVEGGFFAEQDFLTEINNAQFVYFGAEGYEVSLSTTAIFAGFADGLTEGYVTRFTFTAPIPEPSAYTLLGLSAIGLLLNHRQLRKRRTR